MNIMLLSAQAAQGGGMGVFVMMGAILIIFWLFMVRPQQKKQKKIRNFQNSLQEGSKVVTGGGIYGTIKRVDIQANTVDVEIARGVVITVNKGYVFEDASSQMPNA
ncbi:preprotein translocase subunit YajC [Segatella salivae]|jgi:preprotein translocase, yajC subunit|uniref:Sec translocon accessory complex subunit YajC n=3 Tax=Segatella salivae TaxID=228604 RepID=A0AAW4NNU0_9BACT|nr:preprotein translocase subunit YajC [Segatella salivae]EFV05726.1 preprotein translocase, YajC subunit [Segatella salivae DSM 15606]MBF1522113.1 preprotein translocase subunit YajC [Segatella salivae]MBF1524395.1 preprotein translocase subunit YajC [Segatella salivae]MBF1527021.1 preprotein translocase subunit YajC [Segatella salivae]MBF1532572.1 preprotein translocase subunit YajC [Segatella salivae]